MSIQRRLTALDVWASFVEHSRKKKSIAFPQLSCPLHALFAGNAVRGQPACVPCLKQSEEADSDLCKCWVLKRIPIQWGSICNQLRVKSILHLKKIIIFGHPFRAKTRRYIWALGASRLNSHRSVQHLQSAPCKKHFTLEKINYFRQQNRQSKM